MPVDELPTRRRDQTCPDTWDDDYEQDLEDGHALAERYLLDD